MEGETDQRARLSDNPVPWLNRLDIWMRFEKYFEGSDFVFLEEWKYSMAKDRYADSEKKPAKKTTGTLERYAPIRKTGKRDDYFWGLGKKEDIAVLSATIRSAVAEINYLREYM